MQHFIIATCYNCYNVTIMLQYNKIIMTCNRPSHATAMEVKMQVTGGRLAPIGEQKAEEMADNWQ